MSLKKIKDVLVNVALASVLVALIWILITVAVPMAVEMEMESRTKMVAAAEAYNNDPFSIPE